jgi:Fe-S cluster biosynthesis and repair protein YggX
MARLVNCAKLGTEEEGLESAPFPGKKGLYIFENVSQKAWQEWLSMQTILINEHRLASFELKAKKLIEEEREKFLFGTDFQMPEGYVPQKK